MGKRHSREQRRRLARQAEKSSISAVAAEAGVKPETVVRWCSEFGISGPFAIGAEVGELSESVRADLGNEFASAMSQATKTYVKESREWLEDEEQRREDAIAIRQLIDGWQSEHGQLTNREKSEARARLRR